MHVNNSDQWTEYDRPGSQWFVSIHKDQKHATINSRRPMQGLAIPVETAKAIIEACKFVGHPETPPSPEELTRDTRLAGEVLAWLDEKDWTNEDKVCVSAAVFPVLLVRMSDDKEALDEVFDYFMSIMKGTYELAWKAKSDQRR